MLKLILGILVIAISFQQSLTKIMCKNEKNSDLDWYIAIKYPGVYNFFYLSSETNGETWKLPNYALNSDKNLVALTLSQAYGAPNNKAFYAFYNDDKPKNFSSSNDGHLKGVINFDGETGYWLIHSVPHFPLVRGYSYPDPQHINGQSFFCVSIKTSNLNDITSQLLLMYARVYSYYFPESFTTNQTLQYNLGRLVHNIHTPSIKSNVINLNTISNIPLIHFGKSKLFGNDLYSALIAPQLKENLWVESWLNGNGGKEPSNCQSTYKVYNIKTVKILGVEINDERDHSKWAVTLSNATRATCVGDINRMESQFYRGGGSLCIIHGNVWSAFKKAVVDYEKCQ